MGGEGERVSALDGPYFDRDEVIMTHEEGQGVRDVVFFDQGKIH